MYFPDSTNYWWLRWLKIKVEHLHKGIIFTFDSDFLIISTKPFRSINTIKEGMFSSTDGKNKEIPGNAQFFRPWESPEKHVTYMCKTRLVEKSI